MHKTGKPKCTAINYLSNQSKYNCGHCTIPLKRKFFETTKAPKLKKMVVNFIDANFSKIIFMHFQGGQNSSTRPGNEQRPSSLTTGS